MPAPSHESPPSEIESLQEALSTSEAVSDGLRVSELRYRRLFEMARDGILILDSEWGRVTDSNPFMTELLGYSHDELLGKELWEIGLLSDKDASQEAFQQLKQEGYIRYEDLPLENRNNQRREVEFVSNLYLENGHTVIQCNIRDITDRKKAEKSVEESEERLRLATEGAGVGIWEVTTATGEIIYSQKCYEIFDLPENDPVPITVERILAKIHPDDVEHVRGALERSLRDKCEYHAEYRVPVVGHKMRWVYSTGKPYLDESGRMEKLQGVITDITDRKHVEAILAASAVKNERIAETLQRSMLQSSPRGKFQGISVETLYEASLAEAEVGGDFFDALALDTEHVALIVGDVSGKGLDAAGRTAEVKYALRAFLHENHEPSLALAHLNDFICETHRFDKDGWESFIVLAMAVVNTVTGEAIFSSAGSEPTLVLRKSGEVEQVEIVGTPLGIQSDSIYPASTRVLEPGDTIIMATDGITEARLGMDFLGIEGMVRLAEKAGADKTLLELCHAIYAGALAFADGRLRDDVCLLLARRQ